MATNNTSEEPNISICCNPHLTLSRESFCYRDGSLPADESTIIQEIFGSESWSTRLSPEKIIPRYGLSCIDQEDAVFAFNPTSKDEFFFYLMEGGSLYMKKLTGISDFYWLVKRDYCLKSIATENGMKTIVYSCESVMRGMVDRPVSIGGQDDGLFLVVMLGLSLLSLVATFLVYTIVPELKNLHGSLLRAYMACTIVDVSLMFMARTNFILVGAYPFEIILQFSDLAIYFWLSVMCFDIWWTTRSRLIESEKRNRNPFTIYSFYAWGSSTFICGVGAIVDSIPNLPAGVIGPGFSENSWFTSKAAKWIYMDGPQAVAILGAICFLVLTAMNMYRNGKDSARCTEGSHSSRHNDDKQRFKIYLKLFAITAITWLISFITGWMNVGGCGLGILEIPNALRGFFICMICIRNNKTKRILSKRIGLKDKSSR